VKCNQFFTRSQALLISLFPLPPPIHRLAILVTPTFEVFSDVLIKLSEAVLLYSGTAHSAKNFFVGSNDGGTEDTDYGGRRPFGDGTH
jgi:hypothetical protein